MPLSCQASPYWYNSKTVPHAASKGLHQDLWAWQTVRARVDLTWHELKVDDVDHGRPAGATILPPHPSDRLLSTWLCVYFYLVDCSCLTWNELEVDDVDLGQRAAGAGTARGDRFRHRVVGPQRQLRRRRQRRRVVLVAAFQALLQPAAACAALLNDCRFSHRI